MIKLMKRLLMIQFTTFLRYISCCNYFNSCLGKSKCIYLYRERNLSSRGISCLPAAAPEQNQAVPGVALCRLPAPSGKPHALLQPDTPQEQQTRLKFHRVRPTHFSFGSAALKILQRQNGCPLSPT